MSSSGTDRVEKKVESGHTPAPDEMALPWVVVRRTCLATGVDDSWVADANGSRVVLDHKRVCVPVVRAVNSHADLLAACRSILACKMVSGTIGSADYTIPRKVRDAVLIAVLASEGRGILNLTNGQASPAETKVLNGVLADLARMPDVPEPHPAEMPIRTALLKLQAEHGASAVKVEATLKMNGDVEWWVLFTFGNNAVTVGRFGSTINGAVAKCLAEIPAAREQADCMDRVVRGLETAKRSGATTPEQRVLHIAAEFAGRSEPITPECCASSTLPLVKLGQGDYTTEIHE